MSRSEGLESPLRRSNSAPEQGGGVRGFNCRVGVSFDFPSQMTVAYVTDSRGK